MYVHYVLTQCLLTFVCIYVCTYIYVCIQVNNVHQEIWKAATEVGFFQISNHGISKEEILDAFEQAERCS